MTKPTPHNSTRRSIAVLAALLFAILAMAASGPHPQDAGVRRAVSGAECVTSPTPPAPFCLLCDWAVHSHAMVAAPLVTMAPPPVADVPVLQPDAVPVVTLGRNPTGRAPPLRFT